MAVIISVTKRTDAAKAQPTSGSRQGARKPASVTPAADANGGLDDYISNLEHTAIVNALEESR